jgi:16S rRNA (guanine527-N7)-methyltransferase
MDSPQPSKAALPLNNQTKEKLSRFAGLIHEWNRRINLTGFRTIPEIKEILIGEAIYALPHVKIAGKSVLDFGSGAGIPGLIWAVCEPTIRMTSLEIRQKKIAFQKEVARELQISAEIICGLFPGAVSGRKFDLIVSRAIRFSPKLWDEARHLLHTGGRIVRFAAPDSTESGWQTVRISDRSALLISK